MPKLLVIDDDREMVDLLRRSLTQEGFELGAAYSGEDGLAQAGTGTADLILLDVTLPGINGFEVLRRLRRHSEVPVIMLTARGDEVDKIVGLEIGADDYLAKPFSVRELVARISAILRRSGKAKEPATKPDMDSRVLECGSIRIDVRTRSVRRKNEVISLTTSEFDLLYILMEGAGKPVRREELCKSVLEREHSPFDRGIDNMISGLRRKLGATAEGLERIKTVRNLGYIFVDFGDGPS